jgi:hypothetical protein
MNMSFGEVMNEMDTLRIEVASLQNGPSYRGPEGRRPMRQVISPSEKSIVENTDKRSRILIMIIMLGFSSIETIGIRDFSHKDILTIREQIDKVVFMMIWI